MARLTEETGELAREISHFHGEKTKKSSEKAGSIEEEVGDIIFVLACFANSLDFKLGEAFEQSIQKFEIRDENRWTKKE